MERVVNNQYLTQCVLNDRYLEINYYIKGPSTSHFDYFFTEIHSKTSDFD
jgi:hypothetical protein